MWGWTGALAPKQPLPLPEFLALIMGLCQFCLPLGHVNLSITAEAEETHELCGNKISTTPARGRSDTVVKSLLVKVSVYVAFSP